MGKKEDWEELEKWQERQKTTVVDKYGINIYEENRTKENKKVEIVTKIMDKILKIILGIIIFILASAIIGAFLFAWFKFSQARKSVDADINDITKPFGEKIEIVSQDLDKNDNGKYTLTIKGNRKIIFTAIKHFGNMQDDFLENAKKYHFENWKDSEKSSFITNEAIDENGLLDYDIYIKITSYNEIDEAMKKIIKLAKYFEDQGMYYLAFDLYLKTDLGSKNNSGSSNNEHRIYVYNSYPYPEGFDPIKEAKKQYIEYIKLFNIKTDENILYEE